MNPTSNKATKAVVTTSTRGNKKRTSTTAAGAVAKKKTSSASNSKRKRTSTSNSVTPSSSRRKNNDNDNDNNISGEDDDDSESDDDDDELDSNREKYPRRQTTSAATAVSSRKTAPPTKPRQEEANNNKNNNSSIIVSKPKWIPLYDNPWGEEGYQEGDVLLFGPQRGIGHHEIYFPSLRYKTNPFEANSMYNNTHCTPHEGLSVVCLNRDPLGNIPWGFNVTRHEFDHACLVETIDVNSPASAAKFVGIPSSDQQQSSSGINVNDMIIMINGKQTGGK
jgi:hypothetical protein